MEGKGDGTGWAQPPRDCSGSKRKQDGLKGATATADTRKLQGHAGVVPRAVCRLVCGAEGRPWSHGTPAWMAAVYLATAHGHGRHGLETTTRHRER